MGNGVHSLVIYDKNTQESFKQRGIVPFIEMSRLPEHLEEYVLGFYSLPVIFYASCRSGCTQLVRQLLRFPQLHRYLDRCKLHVNQSFVVACVHGHVDTARLLLLNFEMDKTCFEYAIREAAAVDRVEIIRLVLASNNSPDSDLVSNVLQSACFTGSNRIISLILRKKLLNFNEMPSNLLQRACLTGCTELVQKLLSSGCGQPSKTVFTNAYNAGYREIVDMLIRDPRLSESCIMQAFETDERRGDADRAALLSASISDSHWLSGIKGQPKLST